MTLPVLIRLTRTCTACPAQWEGELEDGRAIYARYRHGWLTVGSGATVDEAVDRFDDLLRVSVGGEHDGWMDEPELMTHLRGVLTFDL